MSGGASRLLIVGDAPRNGRRLAALLQSDGFLTRLAGSGEAALAAVAAEAPDLILLDANLPGIGGFDVAAALQRDPATATIPVIVVTSRSDRGAALDARAGLVADVLSRPVNRTELRLRVRNVLRLQAFADFQRDHAAILERQILLRTRELQKFRAAMDSTPDAILLVDRDEMSFVEFNATACRMFGYERADLFAAGPAALWAEPRNRLEDVYDDIVNGLASGPMAARMRRRDGRQIDVELNQHAHRDGDGWLMVINVRDITERKEAQARLYRLAHYDTLTGLPNRVLFHETLSQGLARAAAARTQVAVAVIDLDHFQEVNDTLGHAFGDKLLCLVADRLAGCIGADDALGRLGSDEFALMRMIYDDDDVTALADVIHAAVNTPLRLDDGDLTLAASVGMAVFPVDAFDATTLLRCADTAIDRTKHAGCSKVGFFTAQMSIDLLARRDLEGALRQALENDEFELHYQPLVDVASGRLAGLEALLRWQRPGRGLVPPGEFVPVLEETGLIVRVGTWAIDEACRQIAAWRQQTGVEIRVAVNVSGRQLVEGDLQADVVAALRRNGVAGALVELELTESSLMVGTDATIAMLDSLKRLAVRVSIDDFGTGYSSLAYLRRFPIDKLKIDIAFIRDITHSDDDATIALAIIGIAHNLRMTVVAEGVETAQQVAYLRDHGCDELQGYYFSGPLSAADVTPLLHDGMAPIASSQHA